MSRSAIALPIPRVPPVTTTERFSSAFIVDGFQSRTETAGSAKPTRPPMVGVASERLRPDSFPTGERFVRGRSARDLVPPGPRPGLARALLGLGRTESEPLEELDLLPRRLRHPVPLRKVEHELFDTRPELGGEVRGRRSDECVDVLFGRLPHWLQA